ncbi:MAG: hypothetical protein ACQEXV_08255 [Bacillota bacterium]
MAVSQRSGPFESEEAERSPLPPDFPHKNLIEKKTGGNSDRKTKWTTQKL